MSLFRVRLLDAIHMRDTTAAESYCKKKNISIDRHTIRHEYASILYEAGIDVKEAQQLLGHAQISTTMDIYTHISESKMKQDFMILANYFGA